MDKNQKKMLNLFSIYKSANSFLWTIALICVISWIARFSILFYDAQQSAIKYQAKIVNISTNVSNNIVSSTVDLTIEGLGTITLNADDVDITKYKDGDKISIYCHNNTFSLTAPKTCPEIILKILSPLSIATLILWIISFIVNKVILIFFFQYGGIEAWAYANIYKNDKQS